MHTPITPIFQHPGLNRYPGYYFLGPDQTAVTSILIGLEKVQVPEIEDEYKNSWITYVRRINPIAPGCYVYLVDDESYAKLRHIGLPDKIYIVDTVENPSGWTPLPLTY